MSAFTQNALTKKGKKQMFQIWGKAAPEKPKKGWFGSLYWEDQKYKAPIEDYNAAGAIEEIGLAEIDQTGDKYQEKYY